VSAHLDRAALEALTSQPKIDDAKVKALKLRADALRAKIETGTDRLLLASSPDTFKALEQRLSAMRTELEQTEAEVRRLEQVKAMTDDERGEVRQWLKQGKLVLNLDEHEQGPVEVERMRGLLKQVNAKVVVGGPTDKPRPKRRHWAGLPCRVQMTVNWAKLIACTATGAT
jgi:predicted  nucleic acid-binding Zn-ribbon protein